MPLKKKIIAPEGWVIKGAYISKDNSSTWDDEAAQVAYKALRSWVRRNNYQLKHSTYELIRLNSWGELYLWTSFTFEKSTSTTDIFKSFTCNCGTAIGIGEFVCPNCGWLFSCNNCYVGGTTLVATPGDNAYYCLKCCKTCSTSGCNNPFSTKGNFDKCYKCSPRIKCMLCAKDTDGNKAKTHVKDSKTWNLCPACYDKSICSRCSSVTTLSVFRGSKICPKCKQDILDEERETLEVWPSEELPISGSMLIPSSPSRPVRTVSIETEFDGNGSEVCRALYLAGLVESPRRGSYSAQTGEGRFPCILKSDSSVSGGELVSYLLDLDNENHAAALLRMTEVMRSCREQGTAQFTPRAGGHIHIDLHGYSQDDLWSYYTLFKFLEMPIYYLGGAGSAEGHRSLTGNSYATPPRGGPFGTKRAFEAGIRRTGRSGLNLQNFFYSLDTEHGDSYSRNYPCRCGKIKDKKWEECTCSLGKATAEWRVWNSNIIPRILHAQISLMQAVTAYAQENDGVTESKFEYLPWIEETLTYMGETTKAKIRTRLEWMHRELPFTTDERDSLVYACKRSEMINLGEEYLDSLLTIPSESSMAEKKKARNPYKRSELDFKKKNKKNRVVRAEEAVPLEVAEFPELSVPIITPPPIRSMPRVGCDCSDCMRSRSRRLVTYDASNNQNYWRS